MKVRDVMTKNVVRIGAEEPAEVAARVFTHYNVGALPVCGADGQVCGILTDRDLVTRCVAPGRSAGAVKVRDIMTGRLVSAGPDMDLGAAARLMGTEQVRRLPVLENGRLCGMVTLGDLVNTQETAEKATNALSEITRNVCQK